MITAVNSYSQNSRVNVNPSFTSIHKANYFVKWDDGHFYKAPQDVVKKLQRNIIRMLNEDMYAAKNPKKAAISRSVTQKEPPSKVIKDVLVKFFKSNDADYVGQNPKGLGMARSFYANNSVGDPDVYIITGSNMHIVEEAAKPIGRVWRKTNEAAERISSDYGVSYEKARELIIPKNEQELTSKKKDYYEIVMDKIHQILSYKNPKDTEFNAYFVPKTKGNTTSYELVDAKFVRPE